MIEEKWKQREYWRFLSDIDSRISLLNRTTKPTPHFATFTLGTYFSYLKMCGRYALGHVCNRHFLRQFQF